MSTRRSVALCAALLLGTHVGRAVATAADEPRPSPTRADGNALLQKKDYAGAEAVFAALVEQNDQDAVSWYLLGYARHAQGRLEPAMEAHRKAATFPAVRVNALYNLGCASALLGRKDDALAALRDAVTAGFRDRTTFHRDPELASLHDDPRFAQILAPLRRGKDAFVEDVRVLYELESEQAGEEFGWVTRTVGDLDGDGATDFATTSPGHRAGGPGAGRVAVWSGRSGKLLFQRDGAAGDRYGNGVAGIGDLKGDGVPDVLVCATQGGPNPGYVEVLSGKDGTPLRRLTGAAAGDSFGLKACAAPDLDGDGLPEIVVSAWRADGAAGVDCGRVTVHSGATGKELLRVEGERAGDLFGSAIAAGTCGTDRVLVVGAMNAGPGQRGRVTAYTLTQAGRTPRFQVDAPPTGANFGQYFACFPGDVDGDGKDDVYVSDFSDSNGAGRVVVLSGVDGHTVLERRGTQPGEGLGTTHATCGDVNGDGRADLLVGAWQNADGARSGGKCLVLSGKDGAVLATFTSRMEQDTLGFDAVGLGDVDGDGAADFVLSAAWSEAHGAKSGRVFVVAGAVRPATK